MTRMEDIPEFVLRVAGFTIVPANRTLTDHGGHTVTLRCQVMRVLVYLLRQANQITTRRELIDALWEGNHAVGEHGLNNAISELRAIFRQYPECPGIIETIPRKGYRFVAAPRIPLPLGDSSCLARGAPAPDVELDPGADETISITVPETPPSQFASPPIHGTRRLEYLRIYRYALLTILLLPMFSHHRYVSTFSTPEAIATGIPLSAEVRADDDIYYAVFSKDPDNHHVMLGHSKPGEKIVWTRKLQGDYRFQPRSNGLTLASTTTIANSRKCDDEASTFDEDCRPEQTQFQHRMPVHDMPE